MTESQPARTGQLRFIAALVALTAIWLAMLLGGNGPLDRRIYEALYVGGDPAFIDIAVFFTVLGEPVILIIASFGVALWLWMRGHRHLPLAFLAIIMAGRALSVLQKHVIFRARPDLETHLVVVKTSSFPSGHSNSSMIFYVMLALILSRGTEWRRVAVGAAIVLSLIIGLSRVMLGVHWPSDVIGGWAFGLLWLLLTLKLGQRFVEHGLRR